MSPIGMSTAARLSNEELLTTVKRLADHERELTADLIAHLAELDKRRLYLAEGCSSLFTYCTQVLHLSEHAAYGRIVAARASRKFPVMLERLRDGSVNLTTICLLAPHLTSENHREVLELAQHKPKREVQELVAPLRPLPPVPDAIRRLPARTLAGDHAAPLNVVVHIAPSDAASDAVMQTLRAPSRPAAENPSAPDRPAIVTPWAPERYKVDL